MIQSENRKVRGFAKSLINAFGYTFQVPSREIASELKSVSYITAIKYRGLLCEAGIMSREMTSRKHGWKYKFNRYKVDKLLSE